jgi:hypothetical protein
LWPFEHFAELNEPGRRIDSTTKERFFKQLKTIGWAAEYQFQVWWWSAFAAYG